MTTNEFVIRPDGSIVKRTTSEAPINILPAIAQAFQTDVRVRLDNVMNLAELGEPLFGMASLNVTAKTRQMWWSVSVRTLNLHTHFVLVKDKMLPDFSAQSGTEMEIQWQVPDEDMSVVLGIQMTMDRDGTYVLGKHYLVAYDRSKRTYRLPLSNLYDHCELCHGQSLEPHASMVAALMTGLKQFRGSLWNKDLNGAFQQSNAPLLFRWKPDNTGFVQLPSERPWPELCQKVANDIITNELTNPKSQ